MEFQPLTNKLRILTESQVGYGILVENDAGSISPTFDMNTTMLREMKEGLVDYTKPIIMYATLQKYDIENRNGRIYPKDILMREVGKYQKIIDMNASYQELDHPECQRVTAEILTTEGWKFIKDVSETEVVYTLNKDTNEIEPQQITKKIAEPYNGKMIKIKSRNIDLLVTPNHRFWFMNKKGIGKFYTAQDILDNKVPDTEYYIPKLGSWGGTDYTDITIDGVDASKLGFNCQKELIDKYSKPISIPSNIFFAFMGIYLAEGHCRGTKGYKGYGYVVTITQKNEEKVLKIRKLLSQTPFEWKETKNPITGKIAFYINDARLYYYLRPLGNSYTKYIPNDLKQAAPHLLNEMIDWFLMGDGRTRKVKQYSAREVFSTSKRLIDDLHEILIKAGGAGNTHTEIRDIDRYIPNDDSTLRLIKGENTKPMHFLHISTTKGLWLDRRTLTVEEVDYDDFVYSVSVPNETYYTRDNGKALWTGNSSIVSLTKGSPFRVLEMFWKDNCLIGKLEIMVSRGWRNTGGLYCGGDMVAHYLLDYNMTLGVSSRGVGTLKNVNGKKMVQPDFELICFDVVSSPSTPGSYIYRHIEDFAKYDEKLVQSVKAQPSQQQNSGMSERDIRKSNMMSRLDQFLGAKYKP